MHEWERYGYSIYFPWIGKKYSQTLGNLWKLVSHIWELCGFLNSIEFYSKPIVWEYISFHHNIPIVWIFALPVLIFTNFLRNPQPGNDMAFHRIFPFYGNLHIPKNWELHRFSSTLNIRGSEECEKSVFFHTFPVIRKLTFPIFWESYGFLLHPKYLRHPKIWNACVFLYFSVLWKSNFLMFWELDGFLLHTKNLRNP